MSAATENVPTEANRPLRSILTNPILRQAMATANPAAANETVAPATQPPRVLFAAATRIRRHHSRRGHRDATTAQRPRSPPPPPPNTPTTPTVRFAPLPEGPSQTRKQRVFRQLSQNGPLRPHRVDRDHRVGDAPGSDRWSQASHSMVVDPATIEALQDPYVWHTDSWAANAEEPNDLTRR